MVFGRKGSGRLRRSRLYLPGNEPKYMPNAGLHGPDAVILVDYPGFNLRLGPRLQRQGIPVYYYTAPQVWA